MEDDEREEGEEEVREGRENEGLTWIDLNRARCRADMSW